MSSNPPTKPVTSWEREMVQIYDLCTNLPDGGCVDCAHQRARIEEIRTRINKEK